MKHRLTGGYFSSDLRLKMSDEGDGMTRRLFDGADSCTQSADGDLSD